MDTVPIVDLRSATTPLKELQEGGRPCMIRVLTGQHTTAAMQLHGHVSRDTPHIADTTFPARSYVKGFILKQHTICIPMMGVSAARKPLLRIAAAAKALHLCLY